MNKTWLAALIAAFSYSAVLNAGTFKAMAGGRMTRNNPSLEIRPALFTPSWNYKSSEYDLKQVRDDGVYEFSMSPGDRKAISGQAVFTGNDGFIRADYTFESVETTPLNCLFVSVDLQASEFRGGSWSCGDHRGVFPAEYKELSLMHASAKELSLSTPDGQKSFTFRFPKETSVLIQDNRQWSESFSLRIGRLSRFDFSKGEQLPVIFDISSTDGTVLELQKPVVLTAGKEWIPLDVELEILKGSALDFSALGLGDAPAGKHGRLLCKGPRFEFENLPGKPQRFYGVNFCFSALYPEKEIADIVAERLARIGYNSIRIHHHDSMMTEGSPDGAGLNEESMRRFDLFTAALIRNGIYLSTDLFVSRRVPWKAIGEDRPGHIPMDTFKKLVPVHEGAYNNLRKYVVAWLSHVNPHTGRSYAHEPALAWINILNEANFGNHYAEIKEIPQWREAWRKWLSDKKREKPDLYKDIPDTIPPDVNMVKPDPHKAAFLLFFRDLELEMMTRFRTLLVEELGCRALITNANGWSHYLPDHFTRARTYDFIDEHFYVDHPHFIQERWRLPSRCPNTNPVKNNTYGCRPEIYMRHYDKPFTISEYNYSAPGRFRGVGGILTGTLAALQDWSGLWRFAYSHNDKSLAALESPALGYFDMLNDPLSLAAERASICLFLRGDISPLEKTAVIHLPENRFDSPHQVFPPSKNLWPALGWSRRVGILAGGESPQGYDHISAFPEVFEQYKAKQDVISFIGSDIATLVKENLALRIDNESGTFVINTPGTCGGFTEGGRFSAGPLDVTVMESAATVWVSAVDDHPLKSSKRMVLTHLTDIQNTGIKYAEEERQTLLSWGGLPHIVRFGTAEISLDIDTPDDYEVYALSTGGRRIAGIRHRVENGKLKFTANSRGLDDKAVIIYEIVSD